MAETWKKLAFYDEVATNFLGLSDTPVAYVTVGAYYKVNAAGDGVEEGLVAGAASGLATLDASIKCAQDPKLHAVSHKSGGADSIKLNEFGDPDGAVALAGQQATDLIIHSVVDAASRPTPVVAKICHQQDDEHLYLCTVAA